MMGMAVPAGADNSTVALDSLFPTSSMMLWFRSDETAENKNKDLYEPINGRPVVAFIDLKPEFAGISSTKIREAIKKVGLDLLHTVEGLPKAAADYINKIKLYI